MVDIKSGDILMFPSIGSWVDFFISIVSPRYTHVGIAINENLYIDARIEGIKIRQFSKEHIMVYRTNIDPSDIQTGIMNLLIKSNDNYSVTTAIISGILRILKLRRSAYKLDNKWICSELACWFLRSIGLNALPDRVLSDILPNEIPTIEGLNFIGEING